MTGGIIQLVISGKQDSYLTFNPQITYFKKVFSFRIKMTRNKLSIQSFDLDQTT